MRLDRPTTSVYFDTRFKSAIVFPVKIRVTFYRESKYYPTGVEVTKEDFERINGKRPTPEARERKRAIEGQLAHFEKVLDALPGFSFEKFERAINQTTKDILQIENGFNEKISELKQDKKYGSAGLYANAWNAITEWEAIKSNSKKTKSLKYQSISKDLLDEWKASRSTKPVIIKYQDIDKVFLDEWKEYLLWLGRSETTIGIYMRNLRHVYNRAIEQGVIHQSLSPFKSYKIPVSKNIKKALAIDDISRIANTSMPMTERGRMCIDLFMFSFAANGMNFKDILTTKRNQIEGNLLKFSRAKTINTKKADQDQIVYLHEYCLQIMAKYDDPKSEYVFPFIEQSWSDEEIHHKIKWFIKQANEWLKKVAVFEDIENGDQTSTYYARHSYATAIIRNGYSMEYLQEKLKHSSVKVTQNYIASFGLAIDKEASDKILKGFGNGN